MNPKSLVARAATSSPRLKRGVVATVITSLAVVGTALAVDEGPTVEHPAYTGDKIHKADVQLHEGKNVILLLGDGMGNQEITAARNYQVGAAGRLAMDGLPIFGEYTTYALQENNPSKPDYVPDSAATGTAWATGYKTSNNRISTTAGTDRDVPTILEIAKRKGMATGNVSTAEITDATPAVLQSHVRLRGCQGPADMATCPQDKKDNGGPGSIAEQEVDFKADVVLGGGRSRFTQTVTGGPDAGKTVLQSATDKGINYVSTAAGLDAATGDKPILGLFTTGNMTQEWTGPLAANGNPTTPATCTEGNRPSNEPSLAAMTQKSIDILSAKPRKKGPFRGGFFLQVEGASIDKRDHASDPCGQIGETIAFDNAVKVALDFQKTHPDTMIVVTADHSHTSQIVPTTANTTGASQILTTKEGAPMKLAYGTAPVAGSQEHTGGQVPITAIGPGAARINGLTNQTDLFHAFARTIGAE